MVKLTLLSGLCLGLLLISAPTLAAEPQFTWSATSRASVQYGDPEVEDLGLAVSCDTALGLMISGFLVNEAHIGGHVDITFRGAGFSERRKAVVTECDTYCFSAPVKPDDAAIKALLADQPLTIAQGGQGWTVSGRGAGRVLRPLIKACGVPRRS